jgi:hypothetical protein
MRTVQHARRRPDRQPLGTTSTEPAGLEAVVMRYSRVTLVDVLIYHQRHDIGGCACGWSVLGASHAEHVADIYEMVMSLDEVSNGSE